MSWLRHWHFRRLNVHMRTLNTHEVICIQTSKSRHPVNGCPSLCKSHWQKGNVALGFSAISVYSMAIPYYNKTRAACGMGFIVVRNACSKVHAYTEAEITSLMHSPGTIQLSILCSTYCQRQKTGPEPGNKYSMWIRILLAYGYDRSPSKFFEAGACLPYVASSLVLRLPPQKWGEERTW